MSGPIERPRPRRKLSPWWILAIAGGLLLVAGGALAVWKLWGNGDDTADRRERISIRIRPVVPGAAIPDGRLVVAFFQLNDDLTPRPRFRIGYDVPFAGQTRTIELPLDEVELPTPLDHYQLCPRTCEDLSNPLCGCLVAEPKVALASVLLVVDANSSGAIEPEEVIRPNIYGIGYFFLGAADRAYPLPNKLDPLFTEGIMRGLAPYRVIPPSPGSVFDRLGTAAPGTVFELDVCVPGHVSCKLRRNPNLS